MPVGPAGEQMPYAQEGDAGGSLDEILTSALELFSQARQVADTENERLTIEKITTMIQQVLAQNEKEEQDALAGKLSPRIMSRAYGG